MEYAIETINLSKEFILKKTLFSSQKKKTIKAVDNVTLQIKKGESFGLFGANGSGKTTFLKMLVTLITPTSGSISICNYDIKSSVYDVRRKVGFVFNDTRSFYWRITGRENLHYYLSLYGLSTKKASNRIDRLLDVFGLYGYADRVFGEYSSGIKQKFSIVRALLHDPSVILFDEPIYNVDVASRQVLHKYIKNTLIRDLNKTVIFVSHDQEEIKSFADRVAIMKEGKIIKTISGGDAGKEDIASLIGPVNE